MRTVWVEPQMDSSYHHVPIRFAKVKKISGASWNIYL